ncbi:diguanylate cyclase (GGDEF)-like protein/PAS domain S-box-containing protein [Saccharothrix tamanrassetensis]|uniref:Diguanylate cyclase (GGDEF)-like protein/PAS domain S-box-containing protein n=1 Tax=Saccharothrix tamanrassetensis TaxID=1051531 RepID=A0A841CFS0_9PSEU|nr:EAL domain-containing protein [Saccharothrix tamanrassetensis]MBB5955214.1 diguanylate cyclase (GGDEF)-like protein/PAS domain S-box-containing protein [Saccharothrix tamanrassetensis]
MPKRVGRAPVLLDAARPTGTPLALDGIPLSEGPSLLCDPKGVVMRANAAVAALAKAHSADELVGRALGDLLVGEPADLRLRQADGGLLPVRVARNQVPGTGLHAVLLVDVSDLAKAADDLRDEQRRLRTVQRVAQIGSWEYDPTTGVTVWSESHYEMMGVRPGEVVPGAQAVLDVVHPDDYDMVASYWANRALDGNPIDIVYRIILPTGELRWIRGVAEAKLRADGRTQFITGYIRDITAQLRSDQALETERGRLLEAQRIARIGSWSYEVPTKAVHRSEVLLEMYADLGIAPNADVLCGVHPDDRAALESLRRQLLNATEEETFEAEVRSEFGERVYVCRVRPEFERGKLHRFHGTIQDVTEARALERQLRDDRRRLADAQRAAQLGVWEWNLQTGDVVWSDMLADLFGVPRDEHTRYQTYLDLVHPEDRGWVDDLWQQLAVDQVPVQCEYRIQRRDGKSRVFRSHGVVVKDPDGRPLAVGTAQDITEQRAAETRMKRSSQRFADLVSLTPVGIGLFDEAERLVDANDALCDLLGMDLEKLRGMTADQLTHPDDKANRLDSVSRMTQLGADRVHKVPQRILVRPDGERVYCELHIALSVQDDGRRFWLTVFQDITERRRASEALRHQATHDELTGLPNRALVKEMLAHLLESEDRSRVAVLFCDIDNFKRVNDSLGHDAGDELLVALARRLEGGLPDGCTAARLSGDEYVIICENIDTVGGVDALATKVAGLLRTAVPVHGQLVRVSASIGAAVPNGSRATGNDLLRFADAAMFEAKRAGAGRVSLASAALIASADRQVHLEGQLRDALAHDGLALHFQPVVGVDGAVQTAEALVRWPHPDRGLLPPDIFLPVAEQGDLLRELDRWVLRTALKEAATWPAPNDQPVSVAVNLAGLVPGDPEFVDIVANAIAEAGIPWDRVVLELVETALVDLPSRVRQSMDELVGRGIRFAVDDFGTGYSSLARLKDLPAQIIKVDRRFVSGVGNDSSDFAVARAVVDMARAMGRKCVAEGVETATQFHVLRGVGVDAYQGWLFSRPVPPKEFRAVLALGPLHIPRAG